MNDVSLVTRLRYWVDTALSRGIVTLIVWLTLAGLVLALGVSFIVWLLDAGPPLDYPKLLWLSLMHVIDPGTVTEQDGGWTYLLTMLFATVIGIFLFSTLIAVITTNIMVRVETLARGRSKVVESGHTVIFGWSNKIFTVIEELIAAHDGKKRHCIVVIADEDKTRMDDEIAAKVANARKARIVCRSGSPMEFNATEVVSLEAAKSAIILAPDVAEPDIHVIKTLLAIVNNPRHRGAAHPYHIVTEVRHDESFSLAKEVAGTEVMVEPVRRTISRLIAQRARNPGLSLVHNELLSFHGNEFYVWPRRGDGHASARDSLNALMHKTYGDAVLAFEHCVVAGVSRRHGDEPSEILFNPDMKTPIAEHDQLIVVAKSYEEIGEPTHKKLKIYEDAILERDHEPNLPEKVLILGWNWRAESVIREWAKFVVEGSKVIVVAEWHDQSPTEIEEKFLDWSAISVTCRKGDIASRDVLENLHPEQFNHVIILSYSDSFDPQSADARTLVALIHLRAIARSKGYPFSIVSEMLDVRNRDLAQAERADDFVVSDQTVGRILAQISEQREARNLFNELLASRGADIHLNPADDYVTPGATVNFLTVIEAARRRGESAIGYRTAAHADNKDANYGVVLNPRKLDDLAFTEDDRVIVLGDEG